MAERGHQAIRSLSSSLLPHLTRVVTKMQTFAASGSRGTLELLGGQAKATGEVVLVGSKYYFYSLESFHVLHSGTIPVS